MERLTELIGREFDVDDLARRLYRVAGEIRAPVVGALHVTCSDESERECIDAFQNNFAEYTLPDLKFGERSHFRLANLGGRYEWGAARIAEDHYATPEARSGFKLLLVKLNAHVSTERTASGLEFGRMARYGSESVYCGALHALLDGSRMPFALDLERALTSEGRDRVATLRDERAVPRRLRGLFAAAASARLQARRAILEIQDRRPQSPTLFVVLACVTLNRKSKDRELVCGVYRADWRGERPETTYQGLGDEPSEYRLEETRGALTITDDQIDIPRPARDHRALVRALWEAERGPIELAEGVEPRDAAEALARSDPVSAAILLFGSGVAEMHHVDAMYRLAQGRTGRDEALSLIERIL